MKERAGNPDAVALAILIWLVIAGLSPGFLGLAPRGAGGSFGHEWRVELPWLEDLLRPPRGSTAPPAWFRR